MIESKSEIFSSIHNLNLPVPPAYEEVTFHHHHHHHQNHHHSPQHRYDIIAIFRILHIMHQKLLPTFMHHFPILIYFIIFIGTKKLNLNYHLYLFSRRWVERLEAVQRMMRRRTMMRSLEERRNTLL